MINTWFTADTHFGHNNVIKYCNRPFSYIEEMDDELISRWNEVVKKEDIVWHLGDFCFSHPDTYLDRLNGNIKIIMGSHDGILASTKKQGVICSMMEVISTPFFKGDYNIKMTLCHYALRSWPLSHYGTWHLFGHHHGNLEPYGMSFDVGVDCWNFYPVSMEEVAEKMKTLTPIVDYSEKKLDGKS
jgi:calcineurin-like phosphoesterase family protein